MAVKEKIVTGITGDRLARDLGSTQASLLVLTCDVRRSSKR